MSEQKHVLRTWENLPSIVMVPVLRGLSYSQLVDRSTIKLLTKNLSASSIGVGSVHMKMQPGESSCCMNLPMFPTASSHINLPPHRFHNSLIDFIIEFLDFIVPDGV